MRKEYQYSLRSLRQPSSRTRTEKMRHLTLATTVLAACTIQVLAQSYYFPYTWVCQENRCVKQPSISNDTQQSLSVCMLRCSPHAGLWPRPSYITVHREVVLINANSISITSGVLSGKTLGDEVSQMVQEMSSRFNDRMKELAKKVTVETRNVQRPMEVSLLIEHPEIVKVTHGIDESYKLVVNQTLDGRVNVKITAGSYFGARHGLETMGQLVCYDFVTSSLVMPREAVITDGPAYPYRGILLDTARNYVSIPVLRRTIDAMAANKLNTFHWHITDSHSFPFQSRTFPQLTQFGAYAPHKVYTESDIKALVEFGRIRGVRVIPELDAPAHVGEGWQWADQYEATVCFKKEPWQQYCVEPPCGQINPTSDYAYQILQGVYSDMERLFDSDFFHMGGDEVNLNCWNSSQVIRDFMAKNNIKTDEDGFHQLWNHFQTKALEKLDSVSRVPHQIVIWTSSLTEKDRVEKFLNNSRYIIQIWTTGNNPIMAELVNKGFRVIFSNYDALYFDCGFGAWVGEGNNWCSPYIGWQKVYENRPLSMLSKLGVDISKKAVRDLVLGQEATLWTEQADDQVVEQRLWPRAAAMAERLWSNPEEPWKAAEHRFLYHRERMVSHGTPSDAIEPEWCVQNQGHCYL